MYINTISQFGWAASGCLTYWPAVCIVAVQINMCLSNFFITIIRFIFIVTLLQSSAICERIGVSDQLHTLYHVIGISNPLLRATPAVSSVRVETTQVRIGMRHITFQAIKTLLLNPSLGTRFTNTCNSWQLQF